MSGNRKCTYRPQSFLHKMLLILCIALSTRSRAGADSTGNEKMRRSGPLHEQSAYVAALLCPCMVCKMGNKALQVALLAAITSLTMPALGTS